MPAPKYTIGTRFTDGSTIVGVIDYGETAAPEYLLKGVKGSVKEAVLNKKEVARADEPSAPHSGQEPARPDDK